MSTCSEGLVWGMLCTPDGVAEEEGGGRERLLVAVTMVGDLHPLSVTSRGTHVYLGWPSHVAVSRRMRASPTGHISRSDLTSTPGPCRNLRFPSPSSRQVVGKQLARPPKSIPVASKCPATTPFHRATDDSVASWGPAGWAPLVGARRRPMRTRG